MIDIKQISELWKNEEPEFKKLGEKVVDFLKKGLSKQELLPEITYRTKELLSIIKKIKKKQREKEYSYNDLRDRLGIRIICPFLTDLDIVDSFLKENFEVIKIERKKDSIDFNKLDYQSNHYDVSVKRTKIDFDEHFIFEIQVRTLNQHAWSNSAHTLFYKQEIDMPDEMKRKIYRLLSLYEIADEEFESVNRFLKSQPDNLIYTLVRRLEGKIYKYAQVDFDRDISIENLRIVLSFFNEEELKVINQNIDFFIKNNEDKITRIYNDNRIRFFEIPLLTQPEIFIIWFSLEKFEYSLIDNWDNFSDDSELEQIRSLWGYKI